MTSKTWRIFLRIQPPFISTRNDSCCWNIFIFRVAKWRFIKVILSFSSYDTMGWEGGQSFYPSEIPSRIDRDEVTGLARRETRNSKKSRGGFIPSIPSMEKMVASYKWWYRVPNFHGIIPKRCENYAGFSFSLENQALSRFSHVSTRFTINYWIRKSFRSFVSSGRKVHDENNR